VFPAAPFAWLSDFPQPESEATSINAKINAKNLFLIFYNLLYNS
jgi:hypothetical protein